MAQTFSPSPCPLPPGEGEKKSGLVKSKFYKGLIWTLFFDTYAKVISDWARSEPLIIRAYIYGSRAKEAYKEDSDLDVAIEIMQVPQDNNVLSTWIYEANGLKERLSNKLLEFPGIRLHLELLNGESLTVVGAVRESGILIYQKESI